MLFKGDIVRAKFVRSLSENEVKMRAESSEDKFINSIIEFLLLVCFHASRRGGLTSAFQMGCFLGLNTSI